MTVRTNLGGILRSVFAAVAVAALVLAAGAVRLDAAPNRDPGVGQAGDEGTLCMTVVGSVQGQFPGEASGHCSGLPASAIRTPGGPAIEGTHFDLKAQAGAGGRGGSILGGQGGRQYAPVVFRHRLGDASPMFMIALAQNEVLQTVLFEFFTREMQLYHTIKLGDARVVEVNKYLPDTFAAPADQTVVARVQALEQITIAFRSIEEKSIKSGKVFTDNV